MTYSSEIRQNVFVQFTDTYYSVIFIFYLFIVSSFLILFCWHTPFSHVNFIISFSNSLFCSQFNVSVYHQPFFPVSSGFILHHTVKFLIMEPNTVFAFVIFILHLIVITFSNPFFKFNSFFFECTFKGRLFNEAHYFSFNSNLA